MYKTISQIRTALLVYLTHRMALPILRLIRRPQKFSYSKASLQQLPAGTLGRDLINMLDKNGLDLLPYYVKHDIKHILLAYDTTGEGEVCLQCFMLGNRHLSFPVVATVTFGFLTMPEYWSQFIKAFKRGAKSPRIAGWPWLTLLEIPTQSLIKKINNNEKNHY